MTGLNKKKNTHTKTFKAAKGIIKHATEAFHRKYCPLRVNKNSPLTKANGCETAAFLWVYLTAENKVSVCTRACDLWEYTQQDHFPTTSRTSSLANKKFVHFQCCKIKCDKYDERSDKVQKTNPGTLTGWLTGCWGAKSPRLRLRNLCRLFSFCWRCSRYCHKMVGILGNLLILMSTSYVNSICDSPLNLNQASVTLTSDIDFSNVFT